MLRQNRIDLALRSYGIAAEHGHIDPMAWHLSDIGEVTVGAFCLVQQLNGDDAEALKTLAGGIERYPYSARLHRHLVNLHVKHGRSSEALAQVEKMLPGGAQQDALRSAVQGAMLANEKAFAQAVPHLTDAYQAGCRDPICLKWLSVSLLSQGEIDAAEPIIRQWHELEPGNAEIKAHLEAVEQVRQAAASASGEAAAGAVSSHIRIDGAGKTAAPQQERRETAIAPLTTTSPDSPTSV